MHCRMQLKMWVLVPASIIAVQSRQQLTHMPGNPIFYRETICCNLLTRRLQPEPQQQLQLPQRASLADDANITHTLSHPLNRGNT